MGLDPKSKTPLNSIAPQGNVIAPGTPDLLPLTRTARHGKYSKESSEVDRGALLAEGPFWPGWFATALLMMLAVVGSFVIERPANLVPVGDKDAVDMIFDDQSVGFVGRDGAVVQPVPLSRFVPTAPRNEAAKRAMALEAFERAMQRRKQPGGLMKRAQ